MGTNVFRLFNGERIELTESENNQRVADAEAAQAEQDARAWRDSRVSEYGSWQQQLDEIFHDIDAWKSRIQSIKDNHPKTGN